MGWGHKGPHSINCRHSKPPVQPLGMHLPPPSKRYGVKQNIACRGQGKQHATTQKLCERGEATAHSNLCTCHQHQARVQSSARTLLLPRGT
jgi:hypothetical protein